jgi:hypothetical protein
MDRSLTRTALGIITAVGAQSANARRHMGRMGQRSAATVVATASVLFAALVPLAPAAHAAVADITCAGTETEMFSPGLLLAPQTVTLTVHSIYNPCVSIGDLSITFGTTDFSVPGMFSCLDLLEPRSGTMTFDWSNGRQSTFSFNRSATTIGGELVVSETGVITAGEFVGDTVERIVTGLTLNTLQCVSPPGVTSRTGVVSLVITSA